jgi:galactokinase
VIDRNDLRAAFVTLHGEAPRLFRAPGRVNLIGEHTDYNEGFVLPMAIDRETVIAGRLRPDRRIVARSLGLDEVAEVDLDRPAPARRGLWIDYLEGVARVLERRGLRLAGADLLVDSDVPLASGLSSSAALEVAAALALVRLAGHDLDPVELARVGQEAEHEWVGAMVGIMDQLASALGRAGHALLVDCRTLEVRPIALSFEARGVAVVVIDTRVRHDLAASEYNTRRRECERGVELLRPVLPAIGALRDVTIEQLARHEHLLPEPIRRRCRHVVTENARTLGAAEALARGDLATMGAAMAASHESLAHDYEVSSPELDALVELAGAVAGVIGTRMTGGGFGGCTVALVARSRVDALVAGVAPGYARRFGREPAFHVVEADWGAAEIG